MPTATSASAIEVRRRGSRVYLRLPARADARAFLAGVAASRHLHRGWVKPPSSEAAFAAYVGRYGGARSRDLARATHLGFLACRVDDGAPVGVFNLSEIVRGSFRSAYLGYYALVPHAGDGYMKEGLALVLAAAFGRLKLHRVEANIQPRNLASRALVHGAGFRREGFSRRYLLLGGRWRDHERWAMLAEDWHPRLRATR
jgi:ribosomal-protein-alanine N-acetyltransferase